MPTRIDARHRTAGSCRITERVWRGGERRDEVAGMKLSNVFIMGKAVLDSTWDESAQEEIFGIQLRGASARGRMFTCRPPR